MVYIIILHILAYSIVSDHACTHKLQLEEYGSEEYHIHNSNLTLELLRLCDKCIVRLGHGLM